MSVPYDEDAEPVNGDWTSMPPRLLTKTEARKAYAESSIDNMLVDQKNKIIKMIDSGNLRGAYTVLEVVSKMWHRLGYGYMTRTLRDRMQEHI